MDGDMHVIYTFTPVSTTDILVNWKVFLDMVETLDESGHRVMNLLGIKIPLILRISQGANLPESTQAEKDAARRYRRFYLALQLRDICNEVPIHSVARKYSMPRGTVQVLAQSAQGFAVGMIKFCEVMGWGR
ncbi:unnamed protein product [Parascedosporium putredinis]|uniref:POLQ-like helical domain-containing protein n=1 Tax=Parascedosporium putredinis TaxID=1442378 RepID=A0A9P1H5Z4_9PEZI|nr:unnamed protein product [Parascedosporium putredinis]CAI7998219.1 unnamed protein product [Parascedosporium putredinis]